MAVSMLTDRQLLDALLEASEGLLQEELQKFASMRDRLADDDGLMLTERQRMWAEEVFHRLRLPSPPSRRRTTLGKAKLGAVERPAPVCWWDGSDPKFHPLKPPKGPSNGRGY